MSVTQHSQLKEQKSQFLSSLKAVPVFSEEVVVSSTWSSDAFQFLSTDRHLSFNVCPRTENDLFENEFLWGIAQKAKISKEDCNFLFDQESVPERSLYENTLAVFLPTKLFHLLRGMSLKEMRSTVFAMVCDIVQGEDDCTESVLAGVCKSIRDPVEVLLSKTASSGSCNGENCDNITSLVTSNSLALDDILMEHGHPTDSWKIQILACFCRNNLELEHGGSATTMDSNFSSGPDSESTKTILSLFDDWNFFKSHYSIPRSFLKKHPDFFCLGENSDKECNQYLAFFLRLVFSGRIDELRRTVECIKNCEKDTKSWLSCIPFHVVVQHIIPPLALPLLTQNEYLG